MATGSGGTRRRARSGGLPDHVHRGGNDHRHDRRQQRVGSNVNGLTFKGFGVLSANGTSAVLMDYKSQHPDVYATLLQILFGKQPGHDPGED